MTHRIHGKIYDLTNFYKYHPGGEDILKLTSFYSCHNCSSCSCSSSNDHQHHHLNDGDKSSKCKHMILDATPMFESYHGLANRPFILKLMKKFEVDLKSKQDDQDEDEDEENDSDTNMESLSSPQTQPEQEKQSVEKEDSSELVEKRTLYTFDEDGFYRTLVKRIRKEVFHVEDENVSIIGMVKADETWIQKIILLFSSFLLFYSMVFIFPSLTFGERDDYIIVQCLFAFISGIFQIQWGFCMMHDASHSAIFRRNHWINDFSRRLWCSWTLWNPSKIWMLHHVHMHHSFTGDLIFDPDIHHLSPYLLKLPEVAKNEKAEEVSIISKLLLWVAERVYLPFDNSESEGGKDDSIIGYSLIAFVFYILAPGLWFGQSVMYLLFYCQVDGFVNVWNMKYPAYGNQGDSYRPAVWEIVIALLQISIQYLRWNIFVTFSYMIGMNLAYAMCIVGDHDTYETAVTNHTKIDDDGATTTAEKEREKVIDWGEAQVRNTSNFARDIPWFSTLFGSINYQIEHHLFPGMNRKLSIILKVYCKIESYLNHFIWKKKDICILIRHLLEGYIKSCKGNSRRIWNTLQFIPRLDGCLDIVCSRIEKE